MNSVEANDPRAPFMQVADDIRAQIADGRFRPGDRLPSGRELAKQYGIALMTAQNALRRLKDEGAVFSSSRGYFVSGDADSEPPSEAPYETLGKELAAAQAQIRDLTKRVAALESKAEQSESAS